MPLLGSIRVGIVRSVSEVRCYMSLLNSQFDYARSARSTRGPYHIFRRVDVTETCREVKMLCGIIAHKYQQTKWYCPKNIPNPPCEKCYRIYIMLDLGGLLDVQE